MAQRWLLKLPTESISMTMMDLEPIYCAEQVFGPIFITEWCYFRSRARNADEQRCRFACLLNYQRF